MPSISKYSIVYFNSRLFASLCLFALLIIATSIIQTAPQVSGGTLAVITPPDRTVSSAGTSTRVALGTPESTGTSDVNPKFSNNAPGYTAAPAGAVGYWSFDDDLDDKSGGRNHGVAKGDAHITSGGMAGTLSLDGKGDYVVVKDNWNLQISGAFTISAWIKFDTLTPAGNYVRILEKGTYPGEQYWMFYIKSAKQVGFGFITSDLDNQVRTKKTDWEAGKWYHVVGTYDPSVSSNNMLIYVNGKLDNQITKTGKPVPNEEPLMIGTRNAGEGEFWTGQIDEVRIYREALTATEVANLNKAPFVSLPVGTNIITWKATDSWGSSASAVQVINVVSSGIATPVTSLEVNGIRFDDSTTGITYVTSASHFNLSVTGGTPLGTNYRFFSADDLLLKPSFTSGKYFQIEGAPDGKYVAQFYSTFTGLREQLKETQVVLDNSPAHTRLEVISGSSDGRVRLTATDNSNGAGVGKNTNSGIYYKLDSATSYTLVQSNNVEVKNVVNGAHTISYYSVDNLGNTETAKSAKFTGTIRSFCSSGCNYNNLQTAINALPSGGGKIYIKDGEYTLSSTITLKSGTILDFSAGASIYFRGDAIPLFRGTTVSNIEIIGGSITAENAGVKAFSFSGSKGIKITGTDVKLVKGKYSAGLYCVNCSGVHILNVDVSGATRLIDIGTSSGMNDGKSSNIWIRNGVYDDASIEGIKVNHSRDVHIIGNTITNTAENGIDIGWNTNSEVRSNRLIGAGLPNGAGIHTDSADGAVIINNYIEDTGQTGISVYRATNIDIIRNTIIDAGNQGISIISKPEPSSNINIKFNHITASTSNAIYQSPEQSNVENSLNTIEDMPEDVLPIYIPGSNPTTINYGNIIS